MASLLIPALFVNLYLGDHPCTSTAVTAPKTGVARIFRGKNRGDHSCSSKAVDQFLAVAKAMIWVESRGDPEAVGDDGRSIGPLQIGRPYWKDACRFMHVEWPYEFARKPEYAVAALYYYSRYYTAAAGIEWVPENIARIHVGGPDGWKQKCTKSYWRRVQKAMESK